jgi:hypothetical protein
MSNEVKEMAFPDSGPYLVAALLCEKVLQEKDETVSIIRMIDRVTLTAPASLSPETLPPLPINPTLFSLLSPRAPEEEILKMPSIRRNLRNPLQDGENASSDREGGKSNTYTLRLSSAGCGE